MKQKKRRERIMVLLGWALYGPPIHIFAGFPCQKPFLGKGNTVLGHIKSPKA